ncbi:unnamed protein product [Umbelopsis vinacea]|jgi:hypothetical protein
MNSNKNSPNQSHKETQTGMETAALSLLLQPMVFSSDWNEEPEMWMDVPDLEIPIDSFFPDFSDDEEDYYQYMPEQDECCICALLEPGVCCLNHSQAVDFHLDVVPIEVFECEDPLLADRPFVADDDINLSFLSNFDLLEF